MLVTSQKVRVYVVIAREPKRLRQSLNQIAASPSAPRNDICFNKIDPKHGVIEMLLMLIPDHETAKLLFINTL